MPHLLILLLALMSLSHARAQDAYVVPEVRVEGERPDVTYLELLPSVTRLEGNALERRKQATLGETLGREPGVNTTFFGPNASRPVIRGLDGDRVRILENSVGTLDASAASPDHAVSVDPLVVDSIEVIRGPSALLYGTAAIGGIVNTRTARIARQPLEASELKLLGQLSSVDRGRSLGVLSRARAGSWVLEADASGRGNEDYETPLGQVRNSAARQYQVGLGATHLGERSRLGLALSVMKSGYGTVAEPTVRIDLERFRLDVESEHRLDSFIETALIRAAATAYRHQELDGDTLGTTFRNRGGELRADFKHRRTGAMEGVYGVQAQVFKFSALGDEAFLPATLNGSYSVFAFEEWKHEHWKPSAGLRFDWSTVASDADAKFTTADHRDFVTPGVSLGLGYEFERDRQLGLNLTYTERAPNYQELFANGEHVATGIEEQGNVNFKPERSLGSELYYRRKNDAVELRTAAFMQNFGNFLALVPTGVPGASGQEIYRYTGVSARLLGFEAELLAPIARDFLGGRLEGELQADFVHGRDLTRDQFLPRMPPLRESVSLYYRRDGWLGLAQLQRSERQRFVVPGVSETPAYNLVNLGVEAPLNTAFGSFRLRLRANNVFDSLARTHTSFLKDLAPLPGRNLVLSVQGEL